MRSNHVIPSKTDLNEEVMRNKIREILRYIGEDPDREGLLFTPERIVDSWKEIFSGYKEDPRSLLKTFDKESYDEMVVLRGVDFYSMCEHHMLPFYGKAYVAYIPNRRIIGVSKLVRLVNIYSRRLQIQERLTDQIARFLMDELEALGAGCIIKARHLCMMMRGVNSQGSEMITSSLLGAFRNSEVRAEFLNLIKL